ncbi:MAG: hypothetical protein KF901_02960 [Myxococcales bacterium]|nr:hypothetical protein [Myxococcales bacterium]
MTKVSEPDSETMGLTKQEHYHFAKLSLFMMRLLSRLQDERAPGGGLDAFIRDLENDNALSSPVPLMNQATFLSHAYIVLVWLRERMVADGVDVDELELGLDVGSQVKVIKHDAGRRKDGSEVKRDLSKPGQVMRTLRNAVGHGRVAFSDDSTWEFTDTNREGELVVLSLRWADLGAVCDAVMFAYQQTLYPH